MRTESVCFIELELTLPSKFALLTLYYPGVTTRKKVDLQRSVLHTVKC